MTHLRSSIVLVLVIALAGCEAEARRSRYQPMPGHPWLQDRESGRYPHAHCQLRVPVARPLPEPLTRPETGDLLSQTYLTAATMESAGIVLTDETLADGWRTWLWRDLPDAARLQGSGRLAITVRWPNADGTLRHEPTEIFALPALEAHPPWRWSAWQRAVQIRSGGHATYEAFENTPESAAPAPEQAFELRCRTVLSEALALPAAFEDDNIGRDEAGRSASGPEPEPQHRP
jgi:hypothetical protein